MGQSVGSPRLPSVDVSHGVIGCATVTQPANRTLSTKKVFVFISPITPLNSIKNDAGHQFMTHCGGLLSSRIDTEFCRLANFRD